MKKIWIERRSVYLKRMPEDLRKYARQTTLRLIIGGITLLFLVGSALILWRYGTGAAVLGLLCLIAGLIPIVIIVLILTGMEWIVKRGRNQ